MMSFFSQMLRYPLTVFVHTMEAFVNAVRDIQKTTDQTIGAMVGGVAQALGNAPGGESLSTDSQMTGGVISGDATQTTRKEERKMADQDLGGDDLKYVSYSILFTKPDLEATLEKQKEQLVSYPTDGGSYGGLKIAHFMGKVGQHEVERPQAWKENNYPHGATDDKHWKIPDEDEQYITFIYSVDRRIPKGNANYPREQVRVLKEIRDKLKL